MSKDPCKKFACDLQKCLTEHNYQESACQRAINAIVDCCKIWKESSVVCSGINISDGGLKEKKDGKTSVEK